MSIQDQIKEIVTNNPVVIFMKGTPDAPQCGFSSQTVQVLQALGAPLTAVNVLADENVRQGIKDFTNWPTIPQVFIKGKFIGGCDIVTQMYQQGDLKQALSEALG